MSRKNGLKKEIQAGAEELLHVSASDGYCCRIGTTRLKEASAGSGRLSGTSVRTAVILPGYVDPDGGGQGSLMSKVDDDFCFPTGLRTKQM